MRNRKGVIGGGALGRLDGRGQGRQANHLGLVLGLERLVFLIEVLAHHFAQFGQIHPARLHHLGRVRVVDQREQQVL